MLWFSCKARSTNYSLNFSGSCWRNSSIKQTSVKKLFSFLQRFSSALNLLWSFVIDFASIRFFLACYSCCFFSFRITSLFFLKSLTNYLHMCLPFLFRFLLWFSDNSQMLVSFEVKSFELSSSFCGNKKF